MGLVVSAGSVLIARIIELRERYAGLLDFLQPDQSAFRAYNLPIRVYEAAAALKAQAQLSRQLGQLVAA